MPNQHTKRWDQGKFKYLFKYSNLHFSYFWIFKILHRPSLEFQKPLIDKVGGNCIWHPLVKTKFQLDHWIIIKSFQNHFCFELLKSLHCQLWNFELLQWTNLLDFMFGTWQRKPHLNMIPDLPRLVWCQSWHATGMSVADVHHVRACRRHLLVVVGETPAKPPCPPSSPTSIESPGTHSPSFPFLLQPREVAPRAASGRHS